MRLASSVVGTLLAVTAASAAAAPVTYRDPEARFVVNVPAGWSAAKPQAENVVLAIAQPSEAAKGGVCYVAVRDMPQTRDTPQAELDEAFAALITTDFWKELFAASGVTNVTIGATGERMQRKRKIFYVLATVLADENGAAKEMTGRQEVHPVPGALHFVQCVAAKADYAGLEREFTTIFASYEPKVNQLIAEASPPSLLTLSAGSHATVTAQNAADVTALNRNAVTTGVSIAGRGQWEICEGPNYTGHCSIAAAGASEPGVPLRIGSVRRYFARDAIAAAAAAEIKAAAVRLARPSQALAYNPRHQ